MLCAHVHSSNSDVKNVQYYTLINCKLGYDDVYSSWFTMISIIHTKSMEACSVPLYLLLCVCRHLKCHSALKMLRGLVMMTCSVSVWLSSQSCVRVPKELLSSITSVGLSSPSLCVSLGGDEAALWAGPVPEESIQRIPQRILWQTWGGRWTRLFSLRSHEPSPEPLHTDGYSLISQRRGLLPCRCYTGSPLVLV